MADPLARLRSELDAAGRDPAAFTTSIGVTIGPGTGDRALSRLTKGWNG